MQRIRWPKNFSVFSGSDSESEGPTARRRAARPAHIHLDTASTTSGSASSSVQGVYLFCAGDQVDLSSLQTPLVPNPVPNTVPAMGTATVSPSDSIFQTSPLRISSLIGIPLLMRRLQAKPTPSSPHFENPLASHLSLDIEGSSADPVSSESRAAIGTVLVVRVDREPLQKELLDRICAFHAKLLGLAQQRGPGAMSDVLKTWATPEKFLHFCMESARAANAGQNLAKSEMLGGSWLDLQRPMATV